MQGNKFNAGKPDISLVSRNMSEAIARALMFGQEKYDRYNYLKGFKYSVLLASLQRHTKQLEWGEDYDSESGLHHLCHMAANVQMLIDNMCEETLEDDRYQFNKTTKLLKKDEI